MPLYDQETVFGRRHLASWLLLCAAGGAVNAIGFVAHARFITHVTGTISKLGIDAGGGRWLALESIVVVGCLVLGATLATPLVGGGAHGKSPRHALPLLVVAATLGLLAALGSLGLLGDFGGDTNELGNFAFLSLLAFAMGLQNAAVAAATSLVVRTTHMTGAATDLGLHLGNALRSTGEARKKAIRRALLRAGKIAAFTVGASVGAIIAARFGFLALVPPGVAVVVATCVSFVRNPRRASVVPVPAVNAT